jgi:hypothetical protein
MFGVQLARGLGMVIRMQVVAMRHMGMMRRRLDILVLVVLSRPAVMLRGLLVMRRGLFVVVGDFVGMRHGAFSRLQREQRCPHQQIIAAR